MPWRAACAAKFLANLAVSKVPGNKLLTVTPFATTLLAKPATKPVSPLRAPLDKPKPSTGDFTALEVMFTIRPNPRNIMPSTVCFINSIGESILASMAFSQSSRTQLLKSPEGGPPELVIKISKSD